MSRSGEILLLACLALLHSNVVALGQSTHPDFTGFYKNNDGFFSHASSLHIGNPIEITDTVCNLDPNQELAFQWDKAGFGTGLFNPLPSGFCMTQTEEGDNYRQQLNSEILFTQHSASATASLYIPTTGQDSNVSLDISDKSDNQGTVVALQIKGSPDGSGNISYTITWQGGGWYGLMALPIPSQFISSIQSQLINQGWSVSVSSPDQQNSTIAQDMIPDIESLNLTADTVIFYMTNSLPHLAFGGQCNFTIPAAFSRPGLFAIIDNSNRILAYTNFALSE